MASVVSIIPIVLLFILMLGFKMAGHKSALLTLVITVVSALYIERRYFLFVTYLIISRYRKTQT